MNYYDLNNEEQQELDEIEATLEKDETPSAPDLEKERKRLQGLAKNTLNKTRNINIRVSERDLHRLKSKAAEEGIPYQTLASSILHKSAK